MKFSLCFVFFIFTTIAQGQYFGSENISYDDYNSHSPFTLTAAISKKGKDRLISYILQIDPKILNEVFPVTLAILDDNRPVARISVLPVDPLRPKGAPPKQEFSVELTPEMAQNSVFAFQLFPNTDKVAFYRLNLSTWPIMVLDPDKKDEKGIHKHTEIPLSDLDSFLKSK